MKERDRKLYIKFRDEIMAGLCEFKMFYLSKVEGHHDKITFLRSLYSPKDDMAYYHNEAFDYQNYDPTPLNIVDRAISGFQSYHINPVDQFFELRNVQQDQEADTSHTLLKALKKRTMDIHKIIQRPQNFRVETLFLRDKLLFNIGAKTVDIDKEGDVAFYHYAPEELAFGSSRSCVRCLWDQGGVNLVSSKIEISRYIRRRGSDSQVWAWS